MVKNVVIIGAGPAGLTAALELLRAGGESYRVRVLEETEALGGLSRTVSYHGNRMDIGGHRFFSRDERVVDWWEALLPLGADPRETDRAMLLRKRVSRILYRGRLFDYPLSLSAAALKSFGPGDALAAGASYLLSAVHKLPEDSLENFYINRFGRRLYSMFFEHYTEKVWGRHPRDISADWGAQRVKGLSIPALLRDILARALPRRGRRRVETSLIEEFRYPKYGPGQLWEAAAAEIIRLGGSIETGCRVTGLTAAEGRVTSVACSRGRESFRVPADVVVSSMPLRELAAGLEGVPPAVRDIAEGLPYRDFITVGLLAERPGAGLPPDCWIYIQDPGVKLGRVQIFNNWSPYMAADPANTVWLGLEYFCAEGDALWQLDERELIDLGARELAATGLLEPGQRILDGHVERVKKAYPAYFDTYERLGSLREYLDSFENLFCVGRNGQHRYNNMDHSMATAFEAVKAIVTSSADKSAVWDVNTEKEYHEAR